MSLAEAMNNSTITGKVTRIVLRQANGVKLSAVPLSDDAVFGKSTVPNALGKYHTTSPSITDTEYRPTAVVFSNAAIMSRSSR